MGTDLFSGFIFRGHFVAQTKGRVVESESFQEEMSCDLGRRVTGPWKINLSPISVPEVYKLKVPFPRSMEVPTMRMHNPPHPGAIMRNGDRFIFVTQEEMGLDLGQRLTGETRGRPNRPARRQLVL
jgi:hypothetical protein